MNKPLAFKGMMDTGREAKVQNELYRILKNVLDKNDSVISGLSYHDVEPEVSVEGGFADIVLYTKSKKPALVIECKKKVAGVPTRTEKFSFDPLSSKVIDQALNYAIKLGAPLFATTNGKKIAIFEVPEKGKAFRIDTNRVYVSEVQLKDDYLEKVLSIVSKAYQGQKYSRTSIDWMFIIKIRSFVEYLSEVYEPAIKEKLDDENFVRINFPSSNPDELNVDTISRQVAYILTNQIIFYKILERKYPLNEMKDIESDTGIEFNKTLREYFTQATIVTNDFEPVFLTGPYDNFPLPDDAWAFDEINAFINDMGKYKLEDIGADVVGFIYETLIPEGERHRLGQFYTPPQIAEFIVKWALTKGNEIVLDPSVGSGTFAVKAYSRLKEIKYGQLSVNVHGQLLSQIYSADINPFPAHLTTMNLAMRDIAHPVSDMNVIISDFFHLRKYQTVVTPYMMRLPSGEVRRKISIPKVDAVVGNPPYTRWTEIQEDTRDYIDAVIGAQLKKYGLTSKGGVRASQSPGIYIHFIIHAGQFVDDGGKVGMIISNDWLQTEYGIRFQQYLLDNYKIIAIIDFSTRLFEIALTATNVILLEKCSSDVERSNNIVSFAYINTKTSVNELLDAIENGKNCGPLKVFKVKQKILPKNEKWTPFMFGAYEYLNLLKKSSKTSPLNKIFKPVKGSITWTLHRSSGLGSKEFFNLNKDDAAYWDINEYLVPTISAARDASTYLFTDDDWQRLVEANKDAYMFLCHKSKNDLDEKALDYIKWGETECYTTDKEKRKKLASDTTAAAERRANSDKYFGWYDLGTVDIRPPYIFTIHNSWTKLRFMISEVPLGLDHGFIVLQPVSNEGWDTRTLKAMAAFFNSSFIQLFAETNGRARGQGALSLDLKPFEELFILDPKKLTNDEIDKLASLFDLLNSMAIDIGDISKSKNIDKLIDVYQHIDQCVSEIAGIPTEKITDLVGIVETLIERRKTRANDAAPDLVSGHSKSKIARPKKIRKKEVEKPVKTLFEFGS